MKILLMIIAAVMLVLSACEGPAGEDGSMMYAGNGPPTGDIGNTGDYIT